MNCYIKGTVNKLPKKPILLFLLTIIDIAILFFWFVVLYPLSPFNFLLAPLLTLLPADIVNSPDFQGNIVPLLILPFILVINVFIVYKQTTAAKNYLLISLLSALPILFALGITFVPTMLGEKWHEKSVTKNLSVDGQPTFILRETANPRNYYLVMKLPVTLQTEFKGPWMNNFYNVRFTPSNKETLASLKACQFDQPYLSTGNLQPPKNEEKNAPGNYEFLFEYYFHGESCNKEVIGTLVGGEIELLDITGETSKVLNTFTVTPFVYE